MENNSVISISKLVKNYGSHEVLKSLDMQVNRGDVYGIVGQNGCGKTTLFKCILGLSEFQGGTLSILGGTNSEENRRNRKNIGFFVGANFFGYMNAKQNLHYYRRAKGIKDRKEVKRVLEIVGLTGKAADAPAKRYSLGMKQRLGIANALLGDPDVLIFDEPTNGLDPQGIADIRNLIKKLNEQYGKTIIVSSHILGELENTAHRFGIVHRGIVIKELDSEQFRTKAGVSALEISDSDVERAKDILRNSGIEVQRVTQASSSLEEYYFSLVGRGD